MEFDLYPILGGTADKARLNFLQQFLRPTTLSLFDRVGVRPGMTCLDLGCGIGEATLDLARLVGSEGRVVGRDMDDISIEMARNDAKAHGLTNVEFRLGDIRTVEETDKFDMVNARFLLSHLRDPASVLAKMRRMVNRGGIVTVEDIDYSGYYCYPGLTSFRRCIELLYEMKRMTGGTGTSGRSWPCCFSMLGFLELRCTISSMWRCLEIRRDTC